MPELGAFASDSCVSSVFSGLCQVHEQGHNPPTMCSAGCAICKSKGTNQLTMMYRITMLGAFRVPVLVCPVIAYPPRVCRLDNKLQVGAQDSTDATGA